MRMFTVSYRINPNAWLNKDVEAETEKEAKASAKEYFIGIFGKEKIEATYKIKDNVRIAEKIITTQEEN